MKSRNLLMIAYHFPPAAVGSGHLRTLALTRYLPQFGWRPVVLSAHPRAYSRRNDRLLAEIPEDLPVIRAFALDARRQLSIKGSYPLLIAQPDRWISWWLGAVPAGLRLVRKHRPRLIWSTYPIATAHLIAYTLHRITGIPWVADFRDPITTDDIGTSAITARTRGWVERRTINHASRSVFTAGGAKAEYAIRYPNRENRLVVIPNGYDERNFRGLGQMDAISASPSERRLTLVHSGVLYRHGRNPEPFFQALLQLRQEGVVSAQTVHIILRASGQNDLYQPMLAALGLEAIVRLAPAVSYYEALAEQAAADGLLLFQGSVYNRQIPAKVYEYLRVGRPIFALTDLGGDTAALLRSEGIDTMAPLDNPAAIAEGLRAYLKRLAQRDIMGPPVADLARYSRESGARDYAKLFDQAVSAYDAP